MDKADKLMHDDINALVDTKLSSAEHAEALTRLSGDAESIDTLHAWQAQREALRALHRPLLDEPIPDTLLIAARRGQQSQQQLSQWWRLGGMAASVMLAFGVGWLANSEWGQQAGQSAQMAANNNSNAGASPQLFVKQASLAHAVFSPEVRHPVEVTVAEQAHLVAWLSKRLGRSLKVPNLSAEGFDLVGGRLLPGEAVELGNVTAQASQSAQVKAVSTRAQFMFQNTAGVRVTLYLGAIDASDSKAAATGMTRETAFKFATAGPVPSFYWVDQGFGYALSGPVSRDVLLKLAESVYAQL